MEIIYYLKEDLRTKKDFYKANHPFSLINENGHWLYLKSLVTSKSIMLHSSQVSVFESNV